MVSKVLANMAKYRKSPVKHSLGQVVRDYRPPAVHSSYADAMRGRGTGGLPGTPRPAAEAAKATVDPRPQLQAPSPSQMGPDASYLMDVANNIKLHDQSVAGSLGHQQGLGLDYGINYQRGADGKLSGLNVAPDVDVTNPFSKAAALQTAFKNRTRGNTTSMAAGGQLYSGALQNAQEQTGKDNQQGLDTLMKNFAASYASDQADITGADNDLSSKNLGAYGDLLARKEQVAPVDSGPSAADFANLHKLLNPPKPRGTTAPRVISSRRQPNKKKAPSVLYLPAAHRRLGGNR